MRIRASSSWQLAAGCWLLAAVGTEAEAGLAKAQRGSNWRLGLGLTCKENGASQLKRLPHLVIQNPTAIPSQTSPYTQSVHLIGSWDNFSKHYPMERDTKRARGQWRGCYAFTDIICDGEGGNTPKRTGGLKMGSTYYYYYELDNGTEHHDPTIPFTTSCPYLPGQPVNLLSVPIEIQPVRDRSASMSSMANGHVKTMNPADKFMTPRAPPPPPTTHLRLNTSPSMPSMKRAARSVSPKPERSPWSPKTFFGLRSPAPYAQESDKRGRSSSQHSTTGRGIGSEVPVSSSRPVELKTKSVPHTRDVSPLSIKRSHSRSREPLPLRQVVPRESGTFTATALVIPDEITEELEDDDNFASQLNRSSLDERGILTQLSPPPHSRMRSPPPSLRPVSNTSKPLPELPEETLLPQPLRLRAVASATNLPRSHFSTSTISTSYSSPTESHFDFSETPSFSDSIDDEDLAADLGSGDEFTYSPLSDATDGRGFTGYSLPDEQYASEQTLRKETGISQLTTSATRATFGGAAAFPSYAGPDDSSMSALEELLSEVGYLGNVIIGK
ncbi:hypothetical protein G7Y89_g195 [Cudoniella acicularis]|uniref:Uncharacterized protein n=1 Tax=Cudoniella acicularis TaxID=354080 RepID=A0A8H4W8J4_9HELO|nr:hypothetical protein G7Y89_g195 [Cudoniella acicularis]